MNCYTGCPRCGLRTGARCQDAQRFGADMFGAKGCCCPTTTKGKPLETGVRGVTRPVTRRVVVTTTDHTARRGPGPALCVDTPNQQTEDGSLLTAPLGGAVTTS